MSLNYTQHWCFVDLLSEVGLLVFSKCDLRRLACSLVTGTDLSLLLLNDVADVSYGVSLFCVVCVNCLTYRCL